jgi:hypothetical protein
VSKKQPAWAQTLVGQTNQLVDTYVEFILHAAQHGFTIKPEDVRTLLVTAFLRYLNVLFPLPVQEKAMRSAHALRRWLAREILEREIPRKPPKRATKSTGPSRNARYQAWIRSLPCCVCGLEPTGEASHKGRDGGMGQKALD